MQLCCPQYGTASAATAAPAAITISSFKSSELEADPVVDACCARCRPLDTDCLAVLATRGPWSVGRRAGRGVPAATDSRDGRSSPAVRVVRLFNCNVRRRRCDEQEPPHRGNQWLRRTCAGLCMECLRSCSMRRATISLAFLCGAEIFQHSLLRSAGDFKAAAASASGGAGSHTRWLSLSLRGPVVAAHGTTAAAAPPRCPYPTA